MFMINLPKFRFTVVSRECRNDRTSLLQRILCWLFDCCPDEAGKGKDK